jgi:hypothetical protein
MQRRLHEGRRGEIYHFSANDLTNRRLYVPNEAERLRRRRDNEANMRVELPRRGTQRQELRGQPGLGAYSLSGNNLPARFT